MVNLICATTRDNLNKVTYLNIDQRSKCEMLQIFYEKFSQKFNINFFFELLYSAYVDIS